MSKLLPVLRHRQFHGIMKKNGRERMKMLFHAKEARLDLGAFQMDYIVFGRGTKPLILLPFCCRTVTAG